MIKKKAKSKKTPKKTQRKTKRKVSSKELHPAEVRKEIAAKVEAQADELADAVIEEGKKGQLATVKYLCEMAHIFPEVFAEDPANDESLAATLLNKLGVPLEPVIHDMYEKGEDILIPPRCPLPDDEEKAVVSETPKELVPAE